MGARRTPLAVPGRTVDTLAPPDDAACAAHTGPPSAPRGSAGTTGAAGGGGTAGGTIGGNGAPTDGNGTATGPTPATSADETPGAAGGAGGGGGATLNSAASSTSASTSTSTTPTSSSPPLRRAAASHMISSTLSTGSPAPRRYVAPHGSEARHSLPCSRFDLYSFPRWSAFTSATLVRGPCTGCAHRARVSACDPSRSRSGAHKLGVEDAKHILEALP